MKINASQSRENLFLYLNRLLKTLLLRKMHPHGAIEPENALAIAIRRSGYCTPITVTFTTEK
ncbi:CinsV18_orph1 protein [Chelonus insularis]|nr:CinsV18_orph1 protein [Chelonus insularis]